MVESDTARVSVLPVAGCDFQAVFLGEGRLGCGRSGRWPAVSPIGFGGNPAGFDRRASRDDSYNSGRNPGWWICRRVPVLEPIEHSVLGKPLDGCLQERMPVLEPLEHSVPEIAWIDGPLEGTPVLKLLRAFASEKASGRWITGGKIGCGQVCTTHHGTVRAFGFGDSFSMGAIGTFKLFCD